MTDQTLLDYPLSLVVTGNHRPADMKDDDLLFQGIKAAIGDTFDVAITEEVDAYYVLFEGEEGQKLTLDATSKKLDSHLALFNAAGQRLTMNEDAVEGSNINAHIEFELPETGSYFLLVTTFEYKAIALHDIEPVTGTITVSIE